MTASSEAYPRQAASTSEMIPFDPSKAINKDVFYKGVFSPISIRQQIAKLCDILGIKTPRNLNKVSDIIPFPAEETITGFAVTIDPGFIDIDHGRAIHKFHRLMSQKNIRIANDLTGRMVGNFKSSQLTKECLEMCLSVGPFKIFPIQTGHKWVKYGPLGARSAMEENARFNLKKGDWVEFPIGLLDCLCLFSVHHDYMLRKDSVLPICAGDELGMGSFVPMIESNGEGPKICRLYENRVFSGVDLGHYSVWSGFVQQN